MGPQRVLQAAGLVALAAIAPPAAAAPRLHERVAVIDVGPEDPTEQVATARRLAAAIVAHGLDPVVGDGVEDALIGLDADRDALELAAAFATAQRAFGELKCGEAAAAARQVIGLAAARRAAGRVVPELMQAWTLVLLCADRDGQFSVAQRAANLLHEFGESSAVPMGLQTKYPAVDAIPDLERVEIDIETDVPGAEIWIDFRRAGTSPLHIELPAGEHVIGAAAGTRRGWAAGTAVRSQKVVRVPLAEAAGPWSDVAARVAGWHRDMPEPSELAWVLGRVHARVALLRYGNQVEAWGQIGRSELPHRLGDDDGVAYLDDIDRLLGLVADRVRSWNDHAPDPDRPLLTESSERGTRGDERDRPTKWWVYAAIAGAAAIGAAIIYAHDSATDRQRVELHYP